MPAAARSAVLFDIDGTLVDTRSLHIDAWLRAFADVGHPVDAWRIHAAIGMDSAELLEVLLQGESDRLGAAAKERHRIHDAAAEERMRTFTGARALLDELARRGLKVVLATSSPEEESATTTRVLGAGGAVLAATTSSDVDRAKPEPDVVQVALQKAEVGAEDAMMVGDAVWDVLPAGRAGVRCIGVRTGGVSGEELEGSGAIAVYDDVAALLEGLDGSPLFSRRPAFVRTPVRGIRLPQVGERLRSCWRISSTGGRHVSRNLAKP
ncbi:MAG: HAD family hydrolase [Acidobacteria bacterium]|nr:HAD family hydrolase [Acidobacteriota bacterium]